MLKIRKANIKDSVIVSNMINKLDSELSGISYTENEDLVKISGELLHESVNYIVFLAYEGTDNYVGLISVTESNAVYAGGRFGIIHELYVTPERRSANIGGQLFNVVKALGKEKEWKRIEVGAPNSIKWGRTIDFYRRMGFEEIGPRMKFVL
ncbi:GNAT family N-acetyltransferase [Paenibacillus mendelii]|uniref:GNAT family N-acetyltransferase n=1 Tax=Paenibacillus mendelii TaxID=206163 RepID=A0ABV6JF94_9BACL|nr:GNAT family N-acetyltransferase [Paenibacillus mendelii]MCQ6557254.1 GNAT family N-acetyltransferase [Paenibacillus mendelii]